MSHSTSLVKGYVFWPRLTMPTVMAGSLRRPRDNEGYYAIGETRCQAVFGQFLSFYKNSFFQLLLPCLEPSFPFSGYFVRFLVA
jgi:hypothetical protein